MAGFLRAHYIKRTVAETFLMYRGAQQLYAVRKSHLFMFLIFVKRSIAAMWPNHLVRLFYKKEEDHDLE